MVESVNNEIFRQACLRTCREYLMKTTQLTAGEELEKQYRDYKEQYELWKEKNKNSTETEAYKAYVKQFEDWEKGVEKRRRNIREKAAQEAENDRLRLMRQEEERVELERLQREVTAEAAAQAQAYAENQQSYLAHHVAAMEAEKNQKTQILPTVHIQPNASYQQSQNDPVSDRLNEDVVMREMMDLVMNGAAAALGKDRKMMSQQQQPMQQPVAAVHSAPPQLWGSTIQPYDCNDPMFLRWGPRAAPAHAYIPPTEKNKVPTACWLLLEETQKRKMMIAPQAPPTNQPIVPLTVLHSIPPPSNMMPPSQMYGL